MAGDLRVVYAARTMQDAYMLKNALEEEGIRAIVTNAVLEGGAGVDVLGWATLARVAVNEENEAAARQLAMEFDRAARPRTLDAEGAAELDSSERVQTAVAERALAGSWPRCPKCGAPRITRCPACGMSGTGFPPGDVQPDPPSPRPLLLCIQCDEPFLPEYAGDCEWCGHEFPDGFRPPEPVETESLSPALLAIVAAAILVVVRLFAYFAFLVRNAA